MKLIRRILYTLLFIFIASTTLLTSCMWFVPSVKKLTQRAKKAHAKYDAIIVPGVPFVEPHWDMVMQMRVIWAVHLYKTGQTENIIMSGAAVYSPFVEAKIMKAFAVKMGVPAEHVFTEERAEHSTENIWYSYKLAKAQGFNAIALASDPYQTRLTYSFARRHCKDLKFLPTVFDTLRTLSHEEPKINFDSLRVQNFVALPDRQSGRERFRGTLGKHIDFKE